MNKTIKYNFILAGVIALLVMPYDLIFNEVYPVCIFRNVTGIECPLCGMTRAGYLMLRFKLCQAAQFNPLIFFIPFLVVIEMLNDYLKFSGIHKIRHALWTGAIVSGILLFIVRIASFFLKSS